MNKERRAALESEANKLNVELTTKEIDDWAQCIEDCENACAQKYGAGTGACNNCNSGCGVQCDPDLIVAARRRV